MSKVYKRIFEIVDKSMFKEIKKETKRLVDIANKRLKRMDDNELSSAAYEKLLEWYDKPRFSTAGLKDEKDWNALIKLYSRVVKWLNYETSTLKGARKANQKIDDLFGRKATDYQKRLAFDVLHRMRESEPLKIDKYGSDQVLHIISQHIEHFEEYEKGSEEYAREIENELERLKEELSKEVDEIVDEEIEELKKKLKFF